jgi:4-hydroxybenzoate polyprenyltransferase
MPDNPFAQLTFKELHLFPRALFVFGVGCIAEGMIRPEPPAVCLGIACFFGAVGINILYDLRRSKGDEAIRIRTEKRWMRGFCATAFILSFSRYWAAYLCYPSSAVIFRMLKVFFEQSLELLDRLRREANRLALFAGNFACCRAVRVDLKISAFLSIHNGISALHFGMRTALLQCLPF